MNKLQPRSKKGPVVNSDGIPYDYIVIIDAGSKGSRVFVYNWLNPETALKKGVDLQNYGGVNLVRRFEESEYSDLMKRDDVDEEEDDEDDSNEIDDVVVEDGDDDEEDSKKGKGKDNGNNVNQHLRTKIKLPLIDTHPKWHRKIKPGISSFKDTPRKVGNHHVKYLLKLAEAIVPKSEYSRTPIYLHSTAGMRLLTPTEQSTILQEACKYIRNKSEFYLPDCDTHVNIIDGDIEGIYGWLSINYLLGSFDNPAKHDHGKSHYTYGLLDMGGASTQVAFQPNQTEIDEHRNSLYKIQLASIGNYQNDIDFNIYSDSFLGFGMYQAHDKYIYHLNNNINPGAKSIEDPCLPSGFNYYDSDHKLSLGGAGDFSQCMESLFPVLENNTYSTTTNNNCNKNSKTSSCLLNDLVPSFDFDINHFVGVSGYWDAITNLLNYDSTKSENFDDAYNYSLIYNETEKLCKTPWDSLKNMNKDKNTDLTDVELSQLCFKSSWILNILHLGLGFPRFGIDKPITSSNFKSFQVIDKLNGSEFTWTLGRALLYANAEYANASALYNGFEKADDIGYRYGASEAVFTYGAEQLGVNSRPEYVDRSLDPYYNDDYNDDYDKLDEDDSGNETKWTIENHRFYGSLVFLSLLLIISYLLLGRTKRRIIIASIKNTIFNSRLDIDSRYHQIDAPVEEETIGFELDDYIDTSSSTKMNPKFNDNDDIDERFKIDDE